MIFLLIAILILIAYELSEISKKLDKSFGYREEIEKIGTNKPTRKNDEPEIHSVKSDRQKMTIKTNGISKTKDELVELDASHMDNVIDSIDDFGRVK